MALEDRQRYDKDTTRLVLAYTEGIDPTAMLLSPEVPVGQSGQYMSYAKGDFKWSGDSKRAPGAGVQRLKIPGGTFTAYALQEHALYDGVDRQDSNRSGKIEGVHETDIKVKGQLIKGALDQELCSTIIALAKTNSNKATPSTKWDAASGQDPIKDLSAGATAMANACGRWPNNLLVSDVALFSLADWARAHYNVATLDSNQAVVEKIVLPHLRIANMYIADARSYGGTNYDSLWSDACYMWYGKKTPVKNDLTHMVTFVPDDVPAYRQLAPYSDEHQTGMFVQGIREYLVAAVCMAAGYYIYDVLT